MNLTQTRVTDILVAQRIAKWQCRPSAETNGLRAKHQTNMHRHGVLIQYKENRFYKFNMTRNLTTISETTNTP